MNYIIFSNLQKSCGRVLFSRVTGMRRPVQPVPRLPLYVVRNVFKRFNQHCLAFVTLLVEKIRWRRRRIIRRRTRTSLTTMPPRTLQRHHQSVRRILKFSSCFMRKLWWLEMVNFIEVLEDIGCFGFGDVVVLVHVNLERIWH